MIFLSRFELKVFEYIFTQSEMAIAYVKTLQTQSIIQAYYLECSLAAQSRPRENQAAIVIQKAWKGYVTRMWLAKVKNVATTFQKLWRGFSTRREYRLKIQNYRKMKRNQIYFDKATIIQKAWRGHNCRKEFDFYKRKLRINEMLVKMEEARVLCQEYHDKMALVEKRQLEHEKQIQLEKLAGKSHHLVGTRSVAGVLNKQKNGLTEELVENSSELKEFKTRTIQKTVPKAPKPAIESNIKRAIGPFPPEQKLIKKLNRPLRPTLRVQTDYYDTRNFNDEYKRQEMSKIVEKNGDSMKYKRYQVSETFDHSPFVKPVEHERFVGVRFHNVLPPIALFDEIY